MEDCILSAKPVLTKSISIEDFKNFYWLKSELIQFCREHGLSTLGPKKELVARTEMFILTGKKITLKSKSSGSRDSNKIITLNTLVENYKNDAVTREFFIAQIGPRFHFTAFLRQFTTKHNTEHKNLTYGDLVIGWLDEEAKKKDPSYLSLIDSQFEYNQFTRDFFAHENGKNKADAIKAWKILTAKRGPNTYAYYKSLYKDFDLS